MPTETKSSADTWQEWRLLLVETMERHEHKLDALDEKVSGIRVSIGKLQVQASLIAALVGAVAGALPAIVAILMVVL